MAETAADLRVQEFITSEMSLYRVVIISSLDLCHSGPAPGHER